MGFLNANFKYKILAYIFALLFYTSCIAAIECEHKADVPGELHIGLYLNEIHSIDFIDSYFVADFWIWFRWDDSQHFGKFNASEFNPLKSFEIIGGRIESKTDDGVEMREGFYYSYARIIARITKRFDISAYPLDQHSIKIQIEDADLRCNNLIYIADIENCGISPSISLPGWNLMMLTPEVKNNYYYTNFGNIALPSGIETSYSQFNFEIHIKKSLYQAFAKTFWVTFIGVCVGLASLFVDPRNFDARFGLLIGSVFAIAANSITISYGLSDRNQFIFSDIIQITSIIIVVCAILWSIIALRLVEREIIKPPVAYFYDKVNFIFLAVIYGSILVGCFLKYAQ
jgi:hypothetical protein